MCCALRIAHESGACRKRTPGPVHALGRRAGGLAAALLATSFLTSIAHAQNATWQAVPTVAGVIAATFDFNANANWTPAAVPTGTASFGATTGPDLSFSVANTVLGGFTFNAGAPAYTFQLLQPCVGLCVIPNLTLTGAGVVNNSASAPTFTVFIGSKLTFQNASTAANSNIVMRLGSLDFQNNSTAGNAVITMPDSQHPGFIRFHNTSSAGNASFTLSESSGAQIPAELVFLDASTAANATIVLNPGVPAIFGGGANSEFGIFGGTDTANAGTAHITVNDQARNSFFASSSAANATIVINGGLVDFRDQSTAANATITVNANGELFVGEQATLGNANITNNNGGLVQFGSGFGFGDTATAGNSTIVNNSGGLIQFYDNTTAGNATITTNSGASTQFFLTSTGGNARFITNAGGTFDMSGLTAAGMTAGSIEGLGSYILGSKALTVGGNNLSTQVGGVISGTNGSLIKTGTGTLTLSGTNTYTGATTVNAGVLSVNGSIVSSSGVTVNAGGTLGGNGLLPSTTINPGGALSPGNSIGTIAITGNLSFVGAGNYIVEVSPASADRTNASGTATLSGTLHAVGLGGAYVIGTKYTVINAAGVIGTFGSLDVAGSFGATRPHIEYDANNVYLVLGQGTVSPFLVGGTPNQRAVAGAIDTALLAGSQPAPFLALFNLSSAQLPAALDALSGEVHASTAGVLVDESRYVRQAVLGRLQQASYGPDMGAMAALSIGGPQAAFADGTELASALAYAKSPIFPKAPPMASRDVVFWAQGFGAWGRFDTDGNATTVRRDLAGFISGVDTRVAGDGRLGLAAGYTSSRNALDGRGTANVETGHVAAYGGWRFGAISLRAGGAYAWHTIDTDRTILLPGFADRATAHYEGGTGQVFGEIGYGFALANIAVEPFAGAAWVRLNTDAAAERGGLAALNIAGTTFETGYSTLGIRAASMTPVGPDMMLIPRASLAWQHAFDGVTPTATLAFQAAPVPFVIAGVPIARDALLAEAGLDLAIGRHATLGVSYVGQLAGNVQDHAAKGKFSWKF
jgi:subtilase-type serine protease